MGRRTNVRWYQCGLIGAGGLAGGTFINFLFGIPSLLVAEGLTWTEVLIGLLQAIAFAAALGFASGAVVGLLLPLSQRVGLWGSIVIGALGTPTTVLLCIFILDRDLFQMEYLSRGIILCVITAILGALLGASVFAAHDGEEIDSEGA